MRSLFTLNYLIVAFNFETFVANLFSKYKQAKRDCRTARSWSTRHCNKQDSAKTEASSSMSLPSNILLCETDTKFHERLAAHRLLSPDKIHINFEKLCQISWSSIGIFIMTNTAVHVLTGQLCKLWEHRFLVPGLASIFPPGFFHIFDWLYQPAKKQTTNKLLDSTNLHSLNSVSSIPTISSLNCT